MLGSIISGIGSVIGGLLGSSDADKQMEMQKAFAKNGIRWKVADANAAGVHPLFALGANTHSYSPTQVGSLGQGIANASEGIGRAIESKQTDIERKYNTQKMALDLQRGELENQVLASQLATRNQAAQPPPMPMVDGNKLERIPGQPHTAFAEPRNPGRIKDVPLERISNAPGRPHMEAAPVTDIGFTRTASGGLAPVYSNDAKTRLEDDFLGMLSWNVRNRLLPSVSASQSTEPYKAPYGQHWEYDVLRQEYVLRNNSK